MFIRKQKGVTSDGCFWLTRFVVCVTKPNGTIIWKRLRRVHWVTACIRWTGCSVRCVRWLAWSPATASATLSSSHSRQSSGETPGLGEPSCAKIYRNQHAFSVLYIIIVNFSAEFMEGSWRNFCSDLDAQVCGSSSLSVPMVSVFATFDYCPLVTHQVGSAGPASQWKDSGSYFIDHNTLVFFTCVCFSVYIYIFLLI